MMPRTKNLRCVLRHVLAPARKRAGVVYTCAPVTRAHIHGVREPATPDVVCVSVYVDRDQRWVLEHFRAPALHTATALTV